jgi:hypothetical protein
VSDAAPGSPLARLRASYAARQEADPSRYVDVWEGELIAKVSRSDDLRTAQGIMRMMGALVQPEVAEALDMSPEDLADILATTTKSLHYRNGDGLEAMLTGDGAPLRFDGPEFGAAIGVPEIATPRAAVFAAFTSPAVEDGPPELDTLRLLAVTTRVCNALMSTREAAQAIVGKASPTVSAETRP